MTLSIEEMKAIIPGCQDGQGGVYIEAIDGGEGRMPSNGFVFSELEGGVVHVWYEYFFACWDGWDSMDDDWGMYDCMTDAVTAVYEHIRLENARTAATQKLADFLEINHKKIMEVAESDDTTEIMVKKLRNLTNLNELFRYEMNHMY